MKKMVLPISSVIHSVATKTLMHRYVAMAAIEAAKNILADILNSGLVL